MNLVLKFAKGENILKMASKSAVLLETWVFLSEISPRRTTGNLEANHESVAKEKKVSEKNRV